MPKPVSGWKNNLLDLRDGGKRPTWEFGEYILGLSRFLQFLWSWIGLKLKNKVDLHMYLLKLSDKNQELFYIDHTLKWMSYWDDVWRFEGTSKTIVFGLNSTDCGCYYNICRPLKAIQVNSKLRICLHSDMWTKIIRPWWQFNILLPGAGLWFFIIP